MERTPRVAPFLDRIDAVPVGDRRCHQELFRSRVDKVRSALKVVRSYTAPKPGARFCTSQGNCAESQISDQLDSGRREQGPRSLAPLFVRTSFEVCLHSTFRKATYLLVYKQIKLGSATVRS